MSSYMYGDVVHILKKPETKQEMIEYVRDSIVELMNMIPVDKIDPDMTTLEVIVKEMTAIDGPFCGVDADGKPLDYHMTVGIKFMAEGDLEDD